MLPLRGILGRKKGMMRTFTPAGQAVAVTVLEVGPCTVLQTKTVENDGYNAVQLGYLEKPLHKLTLPEQGHIKKAGVSHGFYHMAEFKVDDITAFQPGQVITLKDIDIKQLVDIVGYSKGKGFQGTVKRHGFRRGSMGHGSKHHREMGSTGQNTFPAHVIKGKRMPGRMGGDRKTIKNSLVMDIRPEENLLFVKGSVPGAVNQLVYVNCK